MLKSIFEWYDLHFLRIFPSHVRYMQERSYDEKKKKLGWQLEKSLNLCKKTWGIQP